MKNEVPSGKNSIFDAAYLSVFNQAISCLFSIFCQIFLSKLIKTNQKYLNTYDTAETLSVYAF
jgi:hypothetical protein